MLAVLFVFNCKATPNESNCAVRSLIANVVDVEADPDAAGDAGDVGVESAAGIAVEDVVIGGFDGTVLLLLSVAVVGAADDDADADADDDAVETSFFKTGIGFSSRAPQ